MRRDRQAKRMAPLPQLILRFVGWFALVLVLLTIAWPLIAPAYTEAISHFSRPLLRAFESPNVSVLEAKDAELWVYRIVGEGRIAPFTWFDQYTFFALIPLLALFVATPGLGLVKRLVRMGIGLVAMFFAHALYIAVSVELAYAAIGLTEVSAFAARTLDGWQLLVRVLWEALPIGLWVGLTASAWKRQFGRLREATPVKSETKQAADSSARHRGKRMGIVKARWIVAAVVMLAVAAMAGFAVWASDAEMYFSSDKNGENRVTKIQEGDSVWLVVIDGDEDIDCDVRDKVWTDVKVMDTKTGAHIVWKSYIDQNGVDTDGDGAGDLVFHGDATYTPHMGHWPGVSAGWLGADYLEETSASTGVFVSSRPFHIGSRVNFSGPPQQGSHIVGPYDGAIGGPVEPTDFEWGGYLYADGDGDDNGDDRIWVDRAQNFVISTNPGFEVPGDDAYLPPGVATPQGEEYMLGRFENMDTLIGLYVDQNDPGDVALALGKIIDTESTIEWNREVYKDANEAATITVVDYDENLSCEHVEYVPIFILVNPGSWNPQTVTSATDFCMLKRYGGVADIDGRVPDPTIPLVWYSMYDSGLFIDLQADGSNQPNEQGTFYIDYPTAAEGNVTSFDTRTTSGVTRVMFYAEETRADSGIFQLNINQILRDLGFNSLNVRDVLVAYYVDSNDQDDFSLATAYIEEKNHSQLRFTDYARKDTEEFWIGRSPVYIEVTDVNANTDSCCPEKVVVHVCDPHEVDDAEWLVLDELSSNSPIFFTNMGMRLVSVWDAMGIGEPDAQGGYSLKLDNWEMEVFNEDSVYARYNDVVYAEADIAMIGDLDTATAFPPRIESVRVANDISFSVFEVADTQVYDGDTTSMYFLDRQGNQVTGYANSDCVFVQVFDPDQDEDQLRRERIAAFWDGNAGQGQNVPLGPINDAANHADCGYNDAVTHMVNTLLGDTNIFDNGTWGKLYVLNPRNGRWAPFDLLETGMDTGEFVSVTCIDLVSRFECEPNLGVLPGDTILAVYNDPSNHSDVAWISIKVGIGGGAMAGSTTTFVDADGNEVAAYVEGDPVYVRVFDASISGAGSLEAAITVEGVEYDLQAVADATPGTYTTGLLPISAIAGETLSATYVDPADPNDTSSDTVTVVASELNIDRFYASPSPFSDMATFAFIGTGMAETFAVTVYDLRGRLIWSTEEHNVLGVDWNGTNVEGREMANGAYLYVVSASNGDDIFTGKGQVFILR